MNTLIETVKMMNSKDYKERFKAEYWQEKIRHDKLEEMLVKYDADKLDFTPTCPIELLQEQLLIMKKRLYILKVRAQLEGVNLSRCKNIGPYKVAEK